MPNNPDAMNKVLDKTVTKTKNVEVSDTAILHFQKILQKNKDAKGIRLGVKNAGCSGLSYVIDVCTDMTEEDIIFEYKNEHGPIYLIIQQAALSYLKGLKVDYLKEGFNSQIKFMNPNVKSVCGCGESFSIEK